MFTPVSQDRKCLENDLKGCFLHSNHDRTQHCRVEQSGEEHSAQNNCIPFGIKLEVTFGDKEVLLKDVVHSCFGHLWRDNDCLLPAEIHLEMLVWIQRVCLVGVLASELKEIWNMGR